MADQEFLASFGVEIDETGVSRLQAVLEENRELAEEVSSAFSAATEAIRTYLTEFSGDLPGTFSASGRGRRSPRRSRWLCLCGRSGSSHEAARHRVELPPERAGCRRE